MLALRGAAANLQRLLPHRSLARLSLSTAPTCAAPPAAPPVRSLRAATLLLAVGGVGNAAYAADAPLRRAEAEVATRTEPELDVVDDAAESELVVQVDSDKRASDDTGAAVLWRGQKVPPQIKALLDLPYRGQTFSKEMRPLLDFFEEKGVLVGASVFTDSSRLTAEKNVKTHLVLKADATCECSFGYAKRGAINTSCLLPRVLKCDKISDEDKRVLCRASTSKAAKAWLEDHGEESPMATKWAVLDAWLDVEEHARTPYPSTDELADLAAESKLEVSQVQTWLKFRRTIAHMDPRIKKYFNPNQESHVGGHKYGISGYTCHRCGHQGHQCRTCPLTDDDLEELIEQGKAFDPKTLYKRYPNSSCPDWPECVDLCGIQIFNPTSIFAYSTLRRAFFCSSLRTR